MVLMSQTSVEEPEGASAKAFLKKPIEAFELRKLIKDFVPKTKTNDIEKYLNFPKLTVPTGSNFIENKTKELGLSVRRKYRPLIQTYCSHQYNNR